MDVWETRTDGVDDAPKSAPERALDAFWADDPNRPASSYPGAGASSGSSDQSGGDPGSGSSGDLGSAGGAPPPVTASTADDQATGSSSSTGGGQSSSGPITYVINPGGQSITQTSIESINLTGPPPPLVILPSLADPYNSTSASQQQQPSTNPPGGVQEPQDAAAPDAPRQPKPIVSGAGAKIDEMINKSPSLRQLWEDAKAAGWQIMFRDKGGSAADPKDKIVWIDKTDIKDVKNFEIHMSSLLSHEIGHAGTPFQKTIEGVDVEDHVRRNTAKDMAHEGAAAFHNARARDEIIANGGPDIGIRGGFDQEYIRIYEDYKAGRISEGEAISRMTYFMALEPQAIEDGRYLTKQEVAEREYRRQWAENHPATN